MKYSIVVPCYNEEKNIVSLVSELEIIQKAYDIEFIIVDNGSRDGTREILHSVCDNKTNFKIAEVEVNQGYGYGILQGLKASTGDFVGWIHADMQIRPVEILRAIDIIKRETGHKSYVKGKRCNRSFAESFFTFFMGITATLLLHQKMHDINGIPVLFNRELLNSFTKPPYNFALDTYSYYLAKKNGYGIIKYPVVVEKRHEGRSSWNTGLISKIKLAFTYIRDFKTIK